MKANVLGQVAAVALGGALLATTAQAKAEKKASPGHCEAKSCGGSVKLGGLTAANSCGGHKACPGKDGKLGTKDDPWNKDAKSCKEAGGKWTAKS